MANFVRSTMSVVICCPFVMAIFDSKSSISDFLNPVKLIPLTRGFCLSWIVSQILSFSVFDAKIFTEENSDCFQKRLMALVISSPGIFIRCPTFSPEKPINT